ncbi:SigE family RNA polymerase sigma factor [Plantactinospora solaniradicis]|uniref:SigE family RNA polymerase sigma factor n=1 Tax=Plantactinospora solaniradicis TaxID=1723736 RepID=A0ABW1K6H4_9ACTN
MASDDGGFREFVDARYPDLLRVAYHLTGSADEAEDLVQSALVKVMRRWRRVDEPMAYLRRVMVNQHISLWRRYRAREVVTAVLPDRPVRDLADGVAERQVLHQAMRTLAPRTRAVIVLRYVADLPESEVAETLGCSVGSVKSRASRGLARLRAALETPPGVALHGAAMPARGNHGA